MGIMNDVKAPAEKVGVHFSVMGIFGWVVGTVLLVVVFMLVILPMAVKAKSAVGGGQTSAGTTLAEQANNLGVGWL